MSSNDQTDLDIFADHLKRIEESMFTRLTPSDGSMQTPVVIGMQRSASRVTWQILKHLITETERPPSWEWFPDSSDLVIGNEAWPIHVHDYLSKIPAIYTYRHPLEAFLSLKSKFMLDVGKRPNIGTKTAGYDKHHAWRDAMKQIGTHWAIFKRLQEDATTGRKILFLKYEDYYDDHTLRINVMAQFLNRVLTKEELGTIAEKTSLIENYKSGARMKYHHGHKAFSGLVGAESGMQQDHVSPQTMGRPGAWLETQPDFLTAVREGVQPAFEALKEMCEDMGYPV
jgi:hypothetical protein